MKKVIAPLFQPLTIALLLLVFGCVALWWRPRRRGDADAGALRTARWRKVGRSLVTAGAFWLLLIASGPLGGCLLHRLEYTYPPLTEPATHPQAAQAQFVVVLGGGHSPGGNLPATSQLNLTTLARAVEAVRLHQALPQTTVIFSGGAVYATRPNAEIMAEAAASLGMPQSVMETSVDARDTVGEARAIAQRIGDAPFILVTSANHMPRAMKLFRGAGLDPIPAPTGQHTRPNDGTDQPLGVGAFFPSSGRIRALEQATHEYLGMLWGKLRDQW